MIKYLEENENFKDLVKDKKVLVDFYADWCGPCKMMGNVLEEVDFIDIIKVNVDLFPELSKEYAVMSIPTLIYLENGENKNQSVGFIELDKIREMVE
ncbi:MAG: thiol reductase thioredoxin [Firmicutes bacterium]|nr:thiol reductase thioredoxin [Bacillota bacterium]